MYFSPNKKTDPAFAYDNISSSLVAIQKTIVWPIEAFNINTPSRNWKVIPQNTVCHWIWKFT